LWRLTEWTPDSNVGNGAMDSPVREHFRHTPRRRREQMGILQHDMARRFGVTVGMDSRRETGFRLPTDEMRPKIAKTLGLTLEELVGEPVRRPTQEVPILGEIHAGKSRAVKPDQVLLPKRASETIEITWAMFHDFVQESKNPLVALRVAGPGMEPRFRPGDIVFVERTGDGAKAAALDAGASSGPGASSTLGSLIVLDLPGQGFVLKAVIDGADGRYLASLSSNIFPIPLPKRPKVWGVVRGVMGRR
jgi:transcriptional regulator with XRE-family HTH domain